MVKHLLYMLLSVSDAFWVTGFITLKLRGFYQCAKITGEISKNGWDLCFFLNFRLQPFFVQFLGRPDARVLGVAHLLGGGFKDFYVHPKLGKMHPFWLIPKNPSPFPEEWFFQGSFLPSLGYLRRTSWILREIFFSDGLVQPTNLPLVQARWAILPQSQLVTWHCCLDGTGL